jgi:hypothetical protein
MLNAYLVSPTDDFLKSNTLSIFDFEVDAEDGLRFSTPDLFAILGPFPYK